MVKGLKAYLRDFYWKYSGHLSALGMLCVIGSCVLSVLVGGCGLLGAMAEREWYPLGYALLVILVILIPLYIYILLMLRERTEKIKNIENERKCDQILKEFALKKERGEHLDIVKAKSNYNELRALYSDIVEDNVLLFSDTEKDSIYDIPKKLEGLQSIYEKSAITVNRLKADLSEERDLSEFEESERQIIRKLNDDAQSLIVSNQKKMKKVEADLEITTLKLRNGIAELQGKTLLDEVDAFKGISLEFTESINSIYRDMAFHYENLSKDI